MKALTLHQPWASLVALGVKTIETRPWSTKHRGPLAVHAGASRLGIASEHALALQAAEAVDPDGFAAEVLPFGAIVATCRLVDVVPIVDLSAGGLTVQAWIGDYPANHKLSIPAGLWLCDHRTLAPGRHVEAQRPYGDFSPGRYAWLLDDIKPTSERCPVCWGEAPARARRMSQPRSHLICGPCLGEGTCEPVPAGGRQGLWELDHG